jgi:hypothetical protein
VVKQRLGLNCGTHDTIEARRRAASIENYGYSDNCDHRNERRPSRQDDRRRGGCYDSNDNRDCS